MKTYLKVLVCFILTLISSMTGHTQDSNSAKKYGEITGKVTVLEKKFMGGMKEKDDMSGVVVYLTGFQSEPPREMHDLVQEDKTFHPMLLPIVAGQTVTFPNHDDIYHNVFSVSPVKSFDLGQYKSTDPPKDVTFDKPGLVPVYCNIHPQMISFVLVLENKAYAQTGKDGRFTISNVPPGRYSINAWKPRTQRVSKEIEVLPGQELVIDFELVMIEKIPPHKRKDGTDYPEEEDDWE